MLTLKKNVLTELVVEGEIFTIEALVSLNGGALAIDFLDSLTDKEQAQLSALFQRLADTGKIWNEQKFKHLEGCEGLFEFKADENRVFCFFYVGKKVILTHGFRKKKQKTPKEEIQRALKLKAEFERRTNEKTNK